VQFVKLFLGVKPLSAEISLEKFLRNSAKKVPLNFRGHLDCIETLVGLCGSELDVTDSNGSTPLFYAVTLGHAECTNLLLSYGADPNKQDKKGRRYVHSMHICRNFSAWAMATRGTTLFCRKPSCTFVEFQIVERYNVEFCENDKVSQT
jgi:ankyrin repeat protein